MLKNIFKKEKKEDIFDTLIKYIDSQIELNKSIIEIYKQSK